MPCGPQLNQGNRSGMGNRYHLHPVAERVSIPGGDCGSVLQARSQLEAVK